MKHHDIFLYSNLLLIYAERGQHIWITNNMENKAKFYEIPEQPS